MPSPSMAPVAVSSPSASHKGRRPPYHSELPEEYTAYIGFEAEARTVRNPL